jgi:hypothetical protein
LPSRAIATTAPGTLFSPISRAKKRSKRARPSGAKPTSLGVVDGNGVAWAWSEMSPAARAAMVAADFIGHLAVRLDKKRNGPRQERPRHDAIRQREA